MKKHPALAVIELAEIPLGIAVTDAMLKRAPIAFVKSGTISRGRYLTLVGGTTASVEEALAAGIELGGEGVLDRILLADVHPRVFDAIVGARRATTAGALAILETDTVASNVRAAEAALKATEVELVELRLADTGLSGKGISLFQGDLHQVEAAISAALDYLERADVPARHRIIAQPHEALLRQVGVSTGFASQELLELDGEGVS